MSPWHEGGAGEGAGGERGVAGGDDDSGRIVTEAAALTGPCRDPPRLRAGGCHTPSTRTRTKRYGDAARRVTSHSVLTTRPDTL